MKEVLSVHQIEDFISNGFVRVDSAFPVELAAQIRSVLWKDMALDPGNPSTWTRSVIRLGMYTQWPFVASANTPLLHGAFDQLVGNEKWKPCRAMGTFPVRFPSPDDPGDTGWHVDVSFGDPGETDFMQWRANWRSKNRGLLMLFLYSDITEQDAPTRLRSGSHLDIAKLLFPYGEPGLSLAEMVDVFPSLPQREEIWATGKAGTVYLCHPLLLHAAQPHKGKEPRFLAQPPLLLNTELMKEKERNNYSPVERAIEMAVNG